jgi:hypothetical protein
MTTRHPTANASQRARRERIARIDYYPSSDALALIESRRTRYGPTHNNSGIIDTIIAEWAALAGLKQSEIDKLKTPAMALSIAEQSARMRITSELRTSMRARMTSDNLAKCASVRAGASPATPEFLPPSQARAGANNSGSLPTGNKARVICGAKRRRDGLPCQGLSVPGKLRCKWHGGASTGPRTDAGRARSMANLRQNRQHDTGSA